MNILQSMEVNTQPIHVVLGSEPNSDGLELEDGEEEVELPLVLVASEGEAALVSLIAWCPKLLRLWLSNTFVWPSAQSGSAHQSTEN